MSEFTDYLFTRRKAKRLTLRKLCESTGIRADEYSKMEIGIIPPIDDLSEVEQKLGLSEQESHELERLAEDARKNWKPTDRKFLPSFIEFEDGHVPTEQELKRIYEYLDKSLFQ
jgi:transcriptional regulator with XRE-family HTH domain